MRPSISTYLGHKSYEVRSDGAAEDTEYFERVFTSEAERLAADAQAAREPRPRALCC